MSERESSYGEIRFEKLVDYLIHLCQTCDRSKMFTLTQHGQDTCLVLPRPVAKALLAYAKPAAARPRRKPKGSMGQEVDHAREEEGEGGY